ncbi:MAG: energy-coupling factor transporter ATPase [Clostridiales bacterium]|jgi:energy-coupling factor transport system ATP-binding protein|nr:energy-coupling factor transporter ATPase [Clostridiales bacterium]
MEIIKFENVSYEYIRTDEQQRITQRFEAIKQLNLSIEKGEFVAVLGHNGSGKSTLAKLINALIQPKSGTVTVNGFDTSVEENIYKVRKSAGMVFQNPDNQIIASVVGEDVAFGPENLGIKSAEILRRVREALESVGMLKYFDYSPHNLSGGQKQRIAIAGVLAMEPDIIVLDEPTAMLDPLGRRDVLKTVMKLNAEKNITSVLITHFMDEAALAQRIIVMEGGKIAMDGKPAEVFSQVEKMRELRLDVPQITELNYMLKKSGVNMPLGILTVKEMTDELCRLKLRA